MGDQHVGTEHILLALLELEDGRACWPVSVSTRGRPRRIAAAATRVDR